MEGVTDSMKITNYTQEFITDDNKPFDSAHASTLLELKDGGFWRHGLAVHGKRTRT